LSSLSDREEKSPIRGVDNGKIILKIAKRLYPKPNQP
jgi:hypothetical protein